MSIVFSEDQQAAMDYLTESLFEFGSEEDMLAGAAGCGKSTLIDEIVKISPMPVVLAATTGKAKNVIEKKTGRPAFTGHQIAYQGADEDDEGNLFFRRRAEGSVGALAFAKEGTNDRAHRELMAALNSGDKMLLILDEASMADKWFKRDLKKSLKKSVQLLGVGDYFQLPPVAGRKNAGFDLQNATAKLTQVHRQAAGTPNLALVTHIRENKVLPTPKLIETFGMEVLDSDARVVSERLAAWHRDGEDFACLTPTNRTRIGVNNLFRAALGYPAMSAGPQIGERVIVLTNNKHVTCTNGEIGVVREVRPERLFRTEFHGDLHIYRLVVDIEGSRRVLRICLEAWSSRTLMGAPDKGMKDALWNTKVRNRGMYLEKLVGLAPAGAITVHKSQGSQFDKVIVVLEDASWLGREEVNLWYTAYSRGVNTVQTVLGRSHKRRRT